MKRKLTFITTSLFSLITFSCVDDVLDTKNDANVKSENVNLLNNTKNEQTHELQERTDTIARAAKKNDSGGKERIPKTVDPGKVKPPQH